MNKYILLAILIMYSVFAKAQHIEPKYKRAKIHFDDSHTLKHLNTLDVSADHGIQKKGMFIISDFSTEELNRARSEGFQVTILNEDIKVFYKNQADQERSTRNVTCSSNGTTETFETPTNFNQGSMGGYLTYQEALDELDDMVAQYPNLITQKAQISDFLTEGTPDNSVIPSIGSNPIYWLKISDNPNTNEEEPEALYTSIHHAREPMSLMNLVFYMWYLLENYESDDAIKAIVDNTELYFIPVINPDGYLYNQSTDPNGGGLWRKNRNNTNGVDNNRNYDYFIDGDSSNNIWSGPGSSSDVNSLTYHGTAAFSEIENQAVKWFVEQHEFTIALNNHSFGELLYYPFGYADVPTPDDAIFEGLGARLTSQNGYNAFSDSPFSGDSDDFMYGTVGTHDKIFAFTPEIGTSFWPAASNIESICQEMMFLNLTTARMSQNYAILEETGSGFISTTTPTSDFTIQRLGITGTGTFTISLQPVSDNIISQDAPITFSNLNSLEEATGSISYILNSDMQNGTSVIYDLVINNGIYDEVISITKTYGETTQLFLDEGNSSTENFETNDWGTTTTTFVSPSSSITDSPSGDYSNNLNSTIELSENIDLTEAIAASVSFYAQWEIEDTWDYVQFEISKDNGNTWEPQCGIFTSIGTKDQPAEALYDGTQDDWVFEEINLSDYLGETIIARFQLVTDGGVEQDGFYFDDLSFTVISEENLSVSDNAFAKAFTIQPNPTEGQIFISSEIENYKMTIFNIFGQELSISITNSGNNTLDLSSFSSGIYFVNIEEGDKTSVFKIVRL